MNDFLVSLPYNVCVFGDFDDLSPTPLDWMVTNDIGIEEPKEIWLNGIDVVNLTKIFSKVTFTKALTITIEV